MKKKSHALFWLLSPTYKYAERRKAVLLASDNGRALVTQSIKKYNQNYLLITLVLAIIAGLIFNQKYYAHAQFKYVCYAICFCFGWAIFFSRAFEIFKAFLEDAIEKLNHIPSSSALGYGDRLGLAFKSYIELLVGFGALYYILPASLFKASSQEFHFSNIFEAIYFSGVTMATVGYGDITPTSWITQFLVVFQVFCGLTLALVSFTVYASLALTNSPQTISKLSRDESPCVASDSTDKSTQATTHSPSQEKIGLSFSYFGWKIPNANSSATPPGSLTISVVGLLIAILGALIALLSLYFQFLDKTHALSVVVSSAEVRDHEVTFGVVFNNAGDYTEVVTNGGISVSESENSRVAFGHHLENCFQPITIESKKATHRYYTVQIPLREISNRSYTADQVKQYLTIHFNALSPKGTEREASLTLGTIAHSTSTGKIEKLEIPKNILSFDFSAESKKQGLGSHYVPNTWVPDPLITCRQRVAQKAN